MAANRKDFPNCPDGDVLIVLNSLMTYKLHSQILSRASTFFAEELSRTPAPLSAKARRDGATAYRFELTRSMTGDDPFGHLEQRELSDSGNGKPKFINSGWTDLDGLMASEERLRHWDLLLGAFYGIQIKFNQDNMAVLLSDCSGLLDVAESIGSIDRIREIVDLSLMRQDLVLWESIATNPTAWIGLGTRLQSPAIFTEAGIHLVGNWRNIDTHVKANLPEEIREIIERKYNDLEIAKDAIEMRILGHYPRQLVRRATDKPGRPSYASDIYMWMAVCFYRHYFAQAIADGRTRLAPDGGFEFYHVLSKAGPAYLHHEDFSMFHQYFPMSSKGCNCLEANMGILKLEIVKFVEQLVINRTHVDPEKLTYLTCALISKHDFPWSPARGDATASVPQVNILDQQIADGHLESDKDDNMHTEDRSKVKGKAVVRDEPMEVDASDNEASDEGSPVVIDKSATLSKAKGKGKERAKVVLPIQARGPRRIIVPSSAAPVSPAVQTQNTSRKRRAETSLPESAACKKRVARAKTAAPADVTEKDDDDDVEMMSTTPDGGAAVEAEIARPSVSPITPQ